MLALGIITRTACGGVMSLQVNAVAYARVGVFVRVCLYICERVCKSVMNIRLYVFVCLCFGGLMCWCEDGVFAVYVCGVRVCECMSVSVCLCCCCSCCCVCVCVLLGASMRKSESMYLCVWCLRVVCVLVCMLLCCKREKVGASVRVLSC